MKRVAQVLLLADERQVHLRGVDEGHAGLVVAAE
jgi:hypothetical protein